MNYFLLSKAKIKTKVESDKFLDEYFIEIANSIKEAYETQIISIKNNDLNKLREKGLCLAGLSNINLSNYAKNNYLFAYLNF